MSKFRTIIILCFLLLSSMSYAQGTRQQLEAKRKEIQAEKEKINSLLSQAISEEKSYLIHLNEINLKIDVQQKLINAFKAESRALNKEINANQKEIKLLDEELKKLKKDYGDMIYKSYKSKSQQSRMMFLMSSNSFHQAYKRLQYMKQYTDFRKVQGEQIGLKAADLNALNDTLQLRRKEQDVLEEKSKIEQSKLEDKKKIQEDIIAKIKKQERKYRNEIKKKQREQKKINEKIEKIIRDAITKANKKSGKKSSGFVLTAEAKLLAADFEENKGKLPWPVERGFVSTRYGKQRHPIYKNNEIQSNGVRITTEKGSNARAVFEGEVIQIQVTTGNKKIVLVRHGNYITVYSNLESVQVKQGDKVSIKQIIGKIFTDRITNKTILSFQIYKNATRMNPATWIYKM